MISPQFFWFKKMRTSIPVMFIISIFINIGMWFERFVIIATTLHRDYLPSSWGYFRPTMVDICTFVGTIGLFMTLFLLFIRFLPVIAISEVKGVLHHQINTHAAPAEGRRALMAHQSSGPGESAASRRLEEGEALRCGRRTLIRRRICIDAVRTARDGGLHEDATPTPRSRSTALTRRSALRVRTLGKIVICWV
ncbi:MAG: hypothetical protein QM757_42665 [Paludibaculum sp.]